MGSLQLSSGVEARFPTVCTCYAHHVAMMTERLQVLLDAERLQRLTREAERRRQPISVLVREAIDAAFPPADVDQRTAAIDRFLALDPMPTEAWETMKADVRDSLYGPDEGSE
jgi:hypothetical protein